MEDTIILLSIFCALTYLVESIFVLSLLDYEFAVTDIDFVGQGLGVRRFLTLTDSCLPISKLNLNGTKPRSDLARIIKHICELSDGMF
jgi:hypothetical protein